MSLLERASHLYLVRCSSGDCTKEQLAKELKPSDVVVACNQMLTVRYNGKSKAQKVTLTAAGINKYLTTNPQYGRVVIDGYINKPTSQTFKALVTLCRGKIVILTQYTCPQTLFKFAGLLDIQVKYCLAIEGLTPVERQPKKREVKS